jgi:hypothetical protein
LQCSKADATTKQQRKISRPFIFGDPQSGWLRNIGPGIQDRRRGEPDHQLEEWSDE